MNKKFLLLFLIFSHLISYPQYLPLRIYTSSDGLASNQVVDIRNDANGALWVSCGSGLSYFTGFKFVNYGLKKGLPNITILKTEPTINGDLFVLTYHGLAYKKAEEDYFKKIPIEGEVIDFAVKEKKGNPHNSELLVCIKNKGVLCINLQDSQKQWVITKKNDPHSITIIKNMAIVSFEDGKIYTTDLTSKKITFLTDLKQPAKLKKYDKNTIFAITEKEIYKITFKGDGFNILTVFSSSDKTLNIFDATCTKKGDLWIGTNKYLLQITPNENKYYTTQNGIPELPIFTVFQSHDGILWFGTNSGLAKLVNNNMLIYKKMENKDIQSCISLFWDKNKKQIWAGINRGVAIIKGKKTFAFHNNYLDQFVIWDIVNDEEGNYYFATEGGGVVKITKQGKTIIYKKEDKCLPDNKVTDLIYLNKTLYVATKNGFAVHKNGKWYIYTTANGLPASYIRSLTQDDKGNIYLATYGAGIVEYKNNGFVQIIKNLKNDYNTMYSIAYKDGIFWATCNYGLVKVKDGIAKLYDTRYGFPNYSGIAVLPLKDFVWVGTDGGLCLFDIKKEKVIEIFTKDEGLPGNEFTTHNAICKDSQGNVWIGVFGGMAKISPQTVLNSQISFNPKIYFKNMTYKYKKQVWKITPTNSLLKIPYGAKDITFNFDIIWFRNDYSTAIFYKLEGESDEWKKIDDLKNTKVQFNFLTFGTYTLALKIVNLGANNQSVEKKITTIIIMKPWWAKKWVIFIIILLFLIGGGLISLFFTYIRTRHLKVEKERLDKLVAEKTEQLKTANELLKEKNKMLEDLAERDFLTNLYNRRHALKVLKLYQKLADRDPNFKISFILIDIDFFKIINDTYGHDAGDFILKELARIFKKITRKSDIVARWGGEEFLIILPKTDLEQAKNVAEKLRQEVEKKYFLYQDKKIKFTISAGISTLDLGVLHSDEDLENILLEVDKKLYQAKQSGRNLIVY